MPNVRHPIWKAQRCVEGGKDQAVVVTGVRFWLSEFMKAVQFRFCLLRRLCENGFAGFQPQSRRGVAVV
jgi:hypothetical protein